MRCFIGIDLSFEAMKEIERLQKIIKPHFVGKTTSNKNLHLTLKFLDEIEDATLNEVEKKLSSIKHQSFELTLNGLGVFSQKFIKMVWVKVTTVPLQPLIDNYLKDIFEPEHRFMGHITIARVKKIEDKQSFIKLINATTINKIIFTVREFYLKESILTNEGPIYKVINKYYVFGHGAQYNLPDKKILMGCYHPSPRNVNTKRLNVKKMVHLFEKVKELLN